MRTVREATHGLVLRIQTLRLGRPSGAQAAKEVAKRAKKGQTVSPVKIEGKAIVTTFWGKAWCTNLEEYSDFANRLPRPRPTSVTGRSWTCKIEKGRIKRRW